MIRKINLILLIIGGVLVFCNHSLAASNDFISDGNITVSNVTFGSTTTDLVIMTNSGAESWTYDAGSLMVTNPDATNIFKVGSTNSLVKAIRVSSGNAAVACVKNTNPGNTYVSLPTSVAIYSVEPLNIDLTNSLSYNSACGAATCSSGYLVSGSGADAVCIAQSSGGGGGGGGASLSSVVTAIGNASSQISLTISSSQGGSLSQTLIDGSKVDVIINQGTVNSQTSISATMSTISDSSSLIQKGITIISNRVFNINAVNSNNQPVSSFSKMLTITLTTPDLPDDTTDLGVYFLNKTSNIWTLVPGAVFDSVNNKVVFSVDHLTEFAILKTNNSVEVINNELATSTTLASLDYIKTVLETEKKLIKNIDKNLTNRLLGRILMQVETLGRAWYLNPVSSERYYLADGNSAFTALRKFGLGIKNTDIAKIPVGIESRFTMLDSDSDGLPDKLEEAIKTDPNKADSDGDSFNDGAEIKSGYDPLSSGKLTYSNSLVNRLKGRILIQTESKGEAWYVNPADGKRYYLANGEAAYQIMRYLSLGITNSNIQKIQVSEIK